MMKRMIALLLACLMVLSLAACGKKNASDATADTDDAKQEAIAETNPDGKTAGELAAENEATQDGTTQSAEADEIIRSEYSSLYDLNQVLGSKLAQCTLAPVTDESFQMVNENGVDIAQYYFVVDGIPCGVRFSTDFEADITGAYKEDGTPVLSDVEGEGYEEFDGCLVGRFLTVDGQYILVVSSTDESVYSQILENLREQAVAEDAEGEVTEEATEETAEGEAE